MTRDREGRAAKRIGDGLLVCGCDDVGIHGVVGLHRRIGRVAAKSMVCVPHVAGKPGGALSWVSTLSTRM